MYSGERALAIAVLDQAIGDFVAGCEMYSTARKSLENKGYVPSTYGTVINDFNMSVNLLVPKTKDDKKDLTVWADMSGMDSDTLTQKFKAILEGNSKLNGESYYKYIRDKWFCEAYLHNNDLLDLEKKIKELETKLKKLDDSELHKQYKDIKTQIAFRESQSNMQIKKQEEKLKELEAFKIYMNKDAYLERQSDCKRLIAIYKDKNAAATKQKIVFKGDRKSA